MANNKGKDIEKAFDAITGKTLRLDGLKRYADGGQPLRYSTEKLKTAFDDKFAHFEINWCSVIVETTLDRLVLNGFDTGEKQKKANDTLDRIFDELHIDIQADEAHKGALVMESAYVIVWKDEDGAVELYYNDPRMCHVFYNPSKPSEKTFAAKTFKREDGATEYTLYYPDRIEHWVSKSKDPKSAPKVNDFELEGDPEKNTFEEIPVFELKTQGEITKVISLQDAINKLFADMMVSSEFGAMPQRYIITNSDVGNLKNASWQIWQIPLGPNGEPATVGQFPSADLNIFLTGMEKLANSMAVISRTPKHYLMTTGADLSGEALLAMEVPLTRKSEKHQRRFSVVWRDIAKFILKLEGIAKIEATEIVPRWERVESVQPFTEAQTRQIAYNTGIPLITLLKREGWTEQEIKELMKDIADQKASAKTQAQAVLDSVRVRSEQDNDVPGITNDPTTPA